tara:strand:- start:232 stop:666 length:435 start_codon:yes stop_codon:yes gene_type:complete
MESNYFYDLPKDLQERIYYINTINSKNILNKDIHSLYSSIKYINRAINDVEPELYNFMDDNNITSYVNELAIRDNIPLLKDEIIEELNFDLLIKKKLSMFYLEMFEYNSDNEFCEELVDGNIINSVEETIGFWAMNMEEHLLQN